MYSGKSSSNSLKVAIRIRPLESIDNTYIKPIGANRLQLTYKSNAQLFNYDYVISADCDLLWIKFGLLCQLRLFS